MGLDIRVSSLPGRPDACSASASSAEIRAVRVSAPPSAIGLFSRDRILRRGDLTDVRPAWRLQEYPGVVKLISEKPFITQGETMAISIRAVHPHFVGEVSGIDLRQALTREQVAA